MKPSGCTTPSREEEYLRFNPFADDRDVKIVNRTVKMVTTKKPHKCFDPRNGQPHEIPAGTRARYEHALVDGKWGSYYICTACLEGWLKEFCDV